MGRMQETELSESGGDWVCSFKGSWTWMDIFIPLYLKATFCVQLSKSPSECVYIQRCLFSGALSLRESMAGRVPEKRLLDGTAGSAEVEPSQVTQWA